MAAPDENNKRGDWTFLGKSAMPAGQKAPSPMSPRSDPRGSAPPPTLSRCSGKASRRLMAANQDAQLVNPVALSMVGTNHEGVIRCRVRSRSIFGVRNWRRESWTPGHPGANRTERRMKFPDK